jgi:predicted transcriptional regulator
MSQVVSARLPEETVERLKRFARRLGKTPSETGAMLIEESLRQEEFALIDFRNSPVGRQAYLANSGLAVWEVMMVAQDYNLDVEAVAHHFQKPTAWVMAAFNYAATYPDEIRLAMEDSDAMSVKALSHLLPQTQILEVPRTVFEEQP